MQATSAPRAPSWVSRIAAIPATYPLVFGAVFTCAKTTGADAFVQLVMEKKTELDLKRISVFAVFGLVWMGVFQYYFYSVWLPRLFPGAASFAAKSLRAKLQDRTGMLAVGGQLVMEQALYVPFLFFPVYYTMKTAIVGDRHKMAEANQGVFAYAFARYKENLVDDMKAFLTIWLPANTINFAFCPMHLRVPFIAAFSFVYCVVLSSMRGSVPTEEAQQLSETLSGVPAGALFSSLEAHFNKPGTVNKDTLSIEDIRSVLTDIGVTDPAAAVQIFDVLDVNNDGVLSRDEFIAVSLAMVHGPAEERMRHLFAACDRNNNGFVDAEELQDIMFALLQLQEALLSSPTAEDGPAGGVPTAATTHPTAHPPKDGQAAATESGPGVTAAPARLETLRAQHPGLAQAATVRELLSARAGELAQEILADADIGHDGTGAGDGQLTEQEFNNWLLNPDLASPAKFRALFAVFTS